MAENLAGLIACQERPYEAAIPHGLNFSEIAVAQTEHFQHSWVSRHDGRVQATKSPSLSPNSPRPGTITRPSGPTLPANSPPTPSSQEESKKEGLPAFSE